MLPVFWVTFKGVLRDRVFQGILVTAVLFLLVPSVSSFSMRQVSELSVTLSLSLLSFILLLLAVFLGGTALWKDIERRYTYSVLGLPVTRTAYLLGKFAGIAGFILVVVAFLGLVAAAVVWFASTAYPPLRPVAWGNLALAIVFDALKYILLAAFAVLFSTVSTSFFLPIFGTVAVFLVGSATQEVYDYIHSGGGQDLPLYVKKIATTLYYILPNFGAFDLKAQAIYGLSHSVSGLWLTAGYFAIYVALVLTLSALIFSRRELL